KIRKLEEVLRSPSDDPHVRVLKQSLGGLTQRNEAIEKARAKVKELTRALQAKQKELVEVRQNLAQLEERQRSGKTDFIIPLEIDATSPSVTVAVPRRTLVIRKELKSNGESDRKAVVRGMSTVERRVETTPMVEQDRRRLEALEQKLQKLLDEVASLKNARTK